MVNPTITHHIIHCLPKTVTLFTGISTMDLIYASLASLALGAGIGFILGRIGLSGVKADVAALKAKVTTSPTPTTPAPVA